MAPPVVTDATNTSDAECLAAALLFLPPSPAPSFSRCTGGVNNIVFYIDRSGLPRLVLRIYNNGKNTARVKYEHAVLSLLAPLSLPFATPRCLPALSDGSSFALLPGGEACCVTECIAGGPAGNGAARSIGSATATLVRSMEGLTVPPGVAAVNPCIAISGRRTTQSAPPPLLRSWRRRSLMTCASTLTFCEVPLRAPRL